MKESERDVEIERRIVEGNKSVKQRDRERQRDQMKEFQSMRDSQIIGFVNISLKSRISKQGDKWRLKNGQQTS